ncbi:hypothetical protein ACVWZW_005066 [Bradyrhizobium sp. F1.13.4]
MYKSIKVTRFVIALSLIAPLTADRTQAGFNARRGVPLMGQSNGTLSQVPQAILQSSELVLTNAKIVTRSTCFKGTVQIVDGAIADISTDNSKARGALDFEGDHLLPGFD